MHRGCVYRYGRFPFNILHKKLRFVIFISKCGDIWQFSRIHDLILSSIDFSWKLSNSFPDISYIHKEEMNFSDASLIKVILNSTESKKSCLHCIKTLSIIFLMLAKIWDINDIFFNSSLLSYFGNPWVFVCKNSFHIFTLYIR